MQTIKQTRNPYDLKAGLEKTQSVKDYLKFISLPILEQQRIWDKWEQYYKDVKKTVVYSMYQELRQAYREGKREKFEELLRDMKDMREKGITPELKTPYEIEPQALSHDQSVMTYKSLLYEIRNGSKANLEF